MITNAGLHHPVLRHARHFSAALKRARGRWVGVLLVATLQTAQAWGPHPAITLAALNALGPNDPLFHLLGSQTLSLTNFCWMADFKRTPFPDGSGYFYADDYLLFPGMPRHLDHICPEVRQTYRPHFQRALQAMRTESQANAARWIGSLLHFVEDTGSPPHAAEIRGGIHGKMENWVDAEKIILEGYKPRLLGADDQAAEEGLIQRMEGLIAFSKVRGEQLRTPVMIGQQSVVRPIVLESALETSRVVADLLHTLGVLGGRLPEADAGLEGIIVSKAPVELEGFPARLVLMDAPVSTLADSSGAFSLRHLAAGRYRLVAIRPGCGSTETEVTLVSGQTNRVEITLGGPDRNYIRNGDFKLQWIQDGVPDGWYRTELGWEGEIIPLQRGTRYRLQADFKAGITADILLRWSRRVEIELPRRGGLPKIDSRPITSAEPALEFEGAENMGLVQVTIRARGGMKPQEVCRSITLVPIEKQIPK